MNDEGGKWSLQNLRGTAGIVLLILIAAVAGIVGLNVAFRGHVQL